MQFNGSKAFSQAFELLRASFGKMAAIWATFFVGIIALLVAFGGMFMAMIRFSAAARTGQIVPGQSPFAGMGFSFILFYILYLAVLFAQQIALSRASTGRDEDTYSVALSAGLRGVLPMMGVLLIYIVAGIGGGIVVSLFMAAIMAAAQSAAVSLLIAVLLGIGAFYLFSRFSLVLPLIAIGELRNPFTAISQSWRLTSSSALKIMAVWFLAVVGALVLYIVVAALNTGLTGAVASTGSMPGAGAMIGLIVIMIAMGLTIGLYMVALTTAIYDQLSPSSIEATAEAFE
ncbi:MAG: glycerophosphoryl diester phosphodiesterase membrane domain-containing protein [Novosphingobium sp.]